MLRSFEQLNQEIERLRSQAAAAERTVAELTVRVNATENTVKTVATQSSALGSIVNLLPDSDFNVSKDDWVSGPPPAGGDISFEAYNWYRFPVTDTLLVEDAAHALKAPGHSLYAANEGANPDIPDWDKVNGVVRLGAAGATNWMLACPLVVNHARPSGQFEFQFIVKLLSSLGLPSTVGLAVAIYDNTVGQAKILEGGDVALTGAPVGVTGATALEYFLVAETDFGQRYKSNLLNVANANAVLDASNYVSLSWTRIVGVIKYDLYRQRGGVIKLIAQIRNGATSWWDQGAEIQTVGAYPTVTLTRARAYVELVAANFGPVATEWKAFDTPTIPVPFNYNSALTTGKQWLIVYPTAATAESRQLRLDRFGLSEARGLWAKSGYDVLAKNNVSTSAASSDQGGVGGVPGDDYNDPFGGERYCVDVKAMVRLANGGQSIAAGSLDVGDVLATKTGGGAARVVEVVRKPAYRPYELVTANHCRLRCSGSHPVLRNFADEHGTPAEQLEVGDVVLTWPRGAGEPELSTLVMVAPWQGAEFSVVRLRLAPAHIFFAGGLASHNYKAY